MYDSELDVLVVGYVMPPYCSITAKSSLKKIPILGWFSKSQAMVVLSLELFLVLIAI